MFVVVADSRVCGSSAERRRLVTAAVKGGRGGCRRGGGLRGKQDRRASGVTCGVRAVGVSDLLMLLFVLQTCVCAWV